MKAVTADYGYDLERKDDHYSITYKRGKFGIPYFLLLLIPGIVIAMFTVMPVLVRYIPRDAVGWGFLIWFIAGMCIAAGMVFFLNKLRGTRAIDIYHDYIVVNGKTYEQRHILGISVRSRKAARDDQQLDNRGLSSTGALGAAGVFGVAGVAASGIGAMTQAANNVGVLVGNNGGAVYNQQAKKSGWSIFIDYGQKEIRIARGLNEKQAGAMARDIHRLLFVEF